MVLDRDRQIDIVIGHGDGTRSGHELGINEVLQNLLGRADGPIDDVRGDRPCPAARSEEPFEVSG